MVMIRVIIAVVACILILAMDAAAGILGINAEAAQNKVKDLKVWLFECKKPSEDAFNLALAAAIVLGVAHLLANLIGCSDCCKPTSAVSGSACRKLSKASLILLWYVTSPSQVAPNITNIVDVCYILNVLYSFVKTLIIRIVVAAALGLLGIGIISNIKSRSSCSLGHHKFLAYGGFACFVHSLFAVVYIAITNAAACCP
ncbi:hypothetical protein Leryth_025483 [Lithospermum erythrorhizon]|nr:hypothetical protein Leryth_025483 [Lithospermum erythrorhizon]